jgi:hypothetical protein
VEFVGFVEFIEFVEFVEFTNEIGDTVETGGDMVETQCKFKWQVKIKS